MNPFLWLILTIIDLYIWLLIASAVLSWLVAFNVVNTRNPLVANIGEFLYRITEPALRPIRNMLPNLGGIDVSPVILIMPNGATYLTIDFTDQPLDNYGPYKVPADSVFVMGDNRDQSADSRAAAIENGLGGAVPLANIGGRAEFITFSLDGSTTWNPATWFSSLRGDRAWTTLRPALAEGHAPK